MNLRERPNITTKFLDIRCSFSSLSRGSDERILIPWRKSMIIVRSYGKISDLSFALRKRNFCQLEEAPPKRGGFLGFLGTF